MATVGTNLLTADEFFEWLERPENQDRHYELERGEIIEMPSPSEQHGAVCWLISMLVGNYLIQRGRGYICTNDAGLIVGKNPDTVRGPDLMVFDESRPLETLSRKSAQGIPKLVVEVLSPSDQATRTTVRAGQYLRRGVPLVWLVDPETRSVTVCQLNQFPVVVDESEELSAEVVLPGFRCKVASLFTLPGQTLNS